MDGQFKRDEFEALIGNLKQFLAAANDPEGEETVMISEVDEIFIELGQLCEANPRAARLLETPLGRWMEMRTGEDSDEALLSELEFISYDLENISDEIGQGEGVSDDLEGGAVPSRGVFDAGLQTMLGKLAALPDRGVLNPARLKSKKGK